MQNETTLQIQMNAQLQEKQLFEQAKQYSYGYFDRVTKMDAVPLGESLSALSVFEQALPDSPQDPAGNLAQLELFGSQAISAQGGGRYFGFVNGGVLPVSLAARWMADAWDQAV